MNKRGMDMSLAILIGFSLALALLCRIVPRRFRSFLLLLGGLAWYASMDVRALPFILLTATSTWFSALQMGRIAEKSKAALAGISDRTEKKLFKQQAKAGQRVWLIGCLLLNFGLLGVLKYTGDVLSWLGQDSEFGLLLPLGISFYTFQSTGYVIDCYQGKARPERNYLKFLLFVSFFPQLIQGPIGRWEQLSGQLEEPASVDLEGLRRALLLILWGFFKKRVLADRAMPFVDEVFADPEYSEGASIVMGVLMYSLQQYCDFSGGIDIVMGIAELFGVHMTPNFRQPYFAVSLGDFWRRWHISLGAWMRDYVFYPFALSRPMAALGKKLKKHMPQLARTLPAALGNILVFLLVGLWHGARANYLFWGLYNGVILAVSALMEPLFRGFAERFPRLCASVPFHIFRVLRTFLIVNIGWYFDRSLEGMDAFVLMNNTVTRFRMEDFTSGVLLDYGVDMNGWWILGIGTLLLFGVSLLRERGVDVRGRLLSLPVPVRYVLLLGLCTLTVAWFVGSDVAAGSFMYAVF